MALGAAVTCNRPVVGGADATSGGESSADSTASHEPTSDSDYGSTTTTTATSTTSTTLDLCDDGVLDEGSFCFSAPVDVPFEWADKFEVGDLNNDGLDDIVASYRVSNEVSVAMSLGTDFASRTVHQVGNGPWSLVLADVTKDGALDIITGHRNSADIAILPGDGDGGVGQISMVLTPEPVQLGVADVDQDGELDAVGINRVTDNSEPATVFLLSGDGSGSFAPAVAVASLTGPLGEVQFILADLDADGVPDIVATADDGNPLVEVALSDGNGGFVSSGVTDVGAQMFHPAVAGLVDGDQDVDIVVFAETEVQFSLVVLLGDGAGGLEVGPRIDEGAVPIPPGFAVKTMVDLDGDGNAEIVAAHRETIVILRAGTDEGVLDMLHTIDWNPGNNTKIEAGDFNGDGAPDLAALKAGDVQVLLANP